MKIFIRGKKLILKRRGLCTSHNTSYCSCGTVAYLCSCWAVGVAYVPPFRDAVPSGTKVIMPPPMELVSTDVVKPVPTIVIHRLCNFFVVISHVIIYIHKVYPQRKSCVIPYLLKLNRACHVPVMTIQAKLAFHSLDLTSCHKLDNRRRIWFKEQGRYVCVPVSSSRCPVVYIQYHTGTCTMAAKRMF